MPEIREVTDLDGAWDAAEYPVLMGDYRRGETLSAWESTPVVPGTPVAAPTPIFRKLDDSVVEEEIARLTTP